MSKSDHREAWYLLLTRWQLAWSRLSGHLPYFQLAIQDYLARVKRTVEEATNERLFTPEEIARRRGQRLGTHTRELLGEDKTDSRWKFWQGWRVTKAEGEKPVRSSLPRLKEVSVAELFTSEERERRLDSRLKVLKIEFRKAHRQMLAVFKRYHQLTGELAEDELDRAFEALEYEYLHHGRKREWFAAYQELAREVALLADDLAPDVEFNEDPIRLLQGDFITTMRNRLATYLKLQKLRAEAFDSGDLDSIRLLSYFKMKQPSSIDFIDPPQPIEKVEQFVSALEYQIGLFRARRAEASPAEASLPALFDHSDRLREWQEFKRQGVMDLEQLGRIAAQCEDWRLHMERFQAEIEVARMKSGGIVNSHHEMETRRKFQQALYARIDEEIETDVAFQQTLQQLVRTGEHADAVRLVLEQLRLTRGRDDSAPTIFMIKAEFVGRFAQKKEPSEVIPLFRKT